MIIDSSDVGTVPVSARVAGNAVSELPPSFEGEVPEAQALLELVLRARAGNVEAQSELIRRYEPRLAGFLRPMVSDRETVKDLLQVIFLKFVTQLASLRNPRVFEPWLFTLARNAVRDHLRHCRCRPVFIPDDAQIFGLCDASCEDRSRDILEALDYAFRRMRAVDRRILREIMKGTAYQRVADQEGVSLAAFKVRLHRLRLELRQQLGWCLGDLLSNPRNQRSRRP